MLDGIGLVKKLALGALVVVAILMGAQALTWGTVAQSLSSVPFTVSGAPEGGGLELDAALSGDVLVATIAVRDKLGQLETDVQGTMALLDAGGETVYRAPLDLVAPGTLRLMAPADQLESGGYLELSLSGEDLSGERAAAYHVQLADMTLTRVKSVAQSVAPASPQATGGPDAFGYTWDNAANFKWVDTSAGTTVPLRDDDWAGPFPLGFTFDFYEESVTQFYVDSNGYIGFDGDQDSSYYANTALGDPGSPNYLIAPFWDDLNPDQGGVVRYASFGTAPNRTTVIEWSAVPLYYVPTDAQTFQIILYEGSNDIKFQYPNTREGPYGDTERATVGIENRDASISLTYPYLIPIDQNVAVLFSYNRAAYNPFLVPLAQGSTAAIGESALFRMKVRNLGTSSDNFTMSRYDFDGADWQVSFYAADGKTPLSNNRTGTIAADGEKEIVVRVAVPAGASVGDWSRAVVQAASQADTSATYSVLLDAAAGTSFAQVYTDDESEDGSEDAEFYYHAVQDGRSYTRRLTSDYDDSSYAGVATASDGDAVVFWNTTYVNSQGTPVSDVQYTIVDRYGSLLRPVTRLSDNSAATLRTYDFSPSSAFVTDDTVAFGWARQEDTDGDGNLDRYNVWYAVHQTTGKVLKAPTALTNNTTEYPKSYPPSIARLSGGRFLLAWEHAQAEGGPVDIFYAILNSDGGVVKPATRLTSGAGFEVTPRVAPMPDGGAAIVWTSYNSSGYPEIAYALLTSTGTVVKSPQVITNNGDSGEGSMAADVVALSNSDLGIAWTHASSSSAQIQYTIRSERVTPTPTHTPTNTPTSPSVTDTPTPTPTTGPVSGIHGTVTYQGSPVSDLILTLRFYDGAAWSTAATTTTGADGVYEFTGVAGLGSGQTYYVRYRNGLDGNADNPDYLGLWACAEITSYTSGATVAGGDFDLEDFSLALPTAGATVTLPANFSWVPRGDSGATYRLMIVNLSTGGIAATVYVDGDNITLRSPLPTGWPSGETYGWFADMGLSDGSYGWTYEIRAVTINDPTSAAANDSASAQSASMPDPASLSGVRENKAGLHSLSALEPFTMSPRAVNVIYTVPNALSSYNASVSVTADDADRLVMTWLQEGMRRYVFHALANKTGDLLTPAMIFQRTRHSRIWSSWNGYGNAPLPPPPDLMYIYLPLEMQDFPEYTPPPQPIVNGGFEVGDFTSWTTYADDSSLAPEVVSSIVHSDSYAAVLGQENAPCEQGQGGAVGMSEVTQQFTVPEVGSPMLSLYYRIYTYDKVNQAKYDRFEIYINGVLVGRFGNTEQKDWEDRCSRPPDDLGWQRFTLDLGAYAGQTIQLQLRNAIYPDDWYGTWTYVDDVWVEFQ